MSVIVTIRMKAEPSRLEEIVAKDPDRIRQISEHSKQHGVIAHRFYGSDDGQVIVIDEWPDEQSFRAFFESQQAEIQPLMQESGVTAPPEITVWRKLETNDEIGWSA